MINSTLVSFIATIALAPIGTKTMAQVIPDLSAYEGLGMGVAFFTILTWLLGAFNKRLERIEKNGQKHYEVGEHLVTAVKELTASIKDK